MRLIVHVGAHKTGTTALQKFLTDRLGELENPRPWYPLPQSHGPGHAQIAWNTFADPRHDNSGTIVEFAQMAQSRGAENVLLSSEEFSVLENADPDYFAGLNSSIELHLICVMTSFQRRYMSWWNEIVKHGHSLPFHSSADTILHLLGETDNFLRRLGVSAPQARFHVIIHDVNDEPRSSIAKFLEVVSAISGYPLSTDGICNSGTNRSLPSAAIELMRMSNAILMENGGSTSKESVRQIRELIEHLSLTAAEAGLLAEWSYNLSEDTLKRLVATRERFLRSLSELRSQGRAKVYGPLEIL